MVTYIINDKYGTCKRSILFPKLFRSTRRRKGTKFFLFWLSFFSDAVPGHSFNLPCLFTQFFKVMMRNKSWMGTNLQEEVQTIRNIQNGSFQVHPSPHESTILLPNRYHHSVTAFDNSRSSGVGSSVSTVLLRVTRQKGFTTGGSPIISRFVSVSSHCEEVGNIVEMDEQENPNPRIPFAEQDGDLTTIPFPAGIFHNRIDPEDKTGER